MSCLFLQVLWEQERAREGLKEKQSFIDLGCGNGLLVYLLTMEGVSIHNELPFMLFAVYCGPTELCTVEKTFLRTIDHMQTDWNIMLLYGFVRVQEHTRPTHHINKQWNVITRYKRCVCYTTHFHSDKIINVVGV